MKKTDERLRHGGGKARQKKTVVRQAVALQYQPPKDNGPLVTARGQGFIADKIIALARKNNIPVHDDPDLVQVLSQLELGDQIPETSIRWWRRSLPSSIISINATVRKNR